MPLYCPDRELYPPDPIEEQQLVVCETCNEQTPEDLAIRDRGGLILCNHKGCIEAARAHDLSYCYSSEEKKVNEYYDKLLNEQK